MTLTKHELKDISDDDEAASGAAASETQIGTTIPDGKTRYIWRIEVGNPNGAVDKLSIFSGEAANKTRNTLKVYSMIANDTIVIGGSPDDPVVIIRPDTTVATTTGNQVYLQHLTAALDVAITYYDL